VVVALGKQICRCAFVLWDEPSVSLGTVRTYDVGPLELFRLVRCLAPVCAAAGTFVRCECVQKAAAGGPKRVLGAGSSPPEQGFQLGQELLNGVQAWAVGWKVEQAGPTVRMAISTLRLLRVAICPLWQRSLPLLLA
jgi:hypothetical protein